MSEDKPADPPREGGGLKIGPGTKVFIKDSSLSNNSGDGMRATGADRIEIARSVFSSNSGAGLNISSEPVMSEQPEPPVKDSGESPAEHWYKKPIGIIGMSVTAGLIVAAALFAISRYF